MWQLIYDSGLSLALRSVLPLYATLLTAHVALVALLAGSSITLLLGGRRETAGTSSRPPRFWVAAALGTPVAGLLLFVSNPFGYVDNPLFLVKMPLAAASIALTWILLRREGQAALGARIGAAALWVATIAAGRLIAFF